MKARLVIVACVLALVGSVAFAATTTTSTSSASGSELKYSYVQGGWANSDPDAGESGSGPALDLSWGVTDMFNVLGSYEDYDYDSADATWMQVGAGMHWPVGQRFDVLGQASFVDAEVETIGGSASENGFAVAGGARKMLSDAWEVNGEIEYVDVGDYDDTLFGVNALYTMKERYALTAGYKVGDNNVMHVGFRWNFGAR